MNKPRQLFALFIASLTVSIGLTAEASQERIFSFDQLGEVSVESVDPELFNESAWVGPELYFTAKGPNGLGIYKLTTNNTVESVALPVDETVIDIPMLASHGNHLIAAFETVVVDSMVDVYSFDGSDWSQGENVHFGITGISPARSGNPKKYIETPGGVFFYSKYPEGSRNQGNVIRFSNGVFEPLVSYVNVGLTNPIVSIGYQEVTGTPGYFWYATQRESIKSTDSSRNAFFLSRFDTDVSLPAENASPNIDAWQMELDKDKVFIDFHFAGEKLFTRIKPLNPFANTGRLKQMQISDLLDSSPNNFDNQLTDVEMADPINGGSEIPLLAKGEITVIGDELVIHSVLDKDNDYLQTGDPLIPSVSTEAASITIVDSQPGDSSTTAVAIAHSNAAFYEPGYVFEDVLTWKHLGSKVNSSVFSFMGRNQQTTQWGVYQYDLSTDSASFTGVSFGSKVEYPLVFGNRLLTAEAAANFSSSEIFEITPSKSTLSSFTPSTIGYAEIIEAKIIDGKPIVISKTGSNYFLVDIQAETVGALGALTGDLVDVEKLANGYLVSTFDSRPEFTFFESSANRLLPNKNIAPLSSTSLVEFGSNLVTITNKAKDFPRLYAFDSNKSYQLLNDLYPGFGLDSLSGLSDLSSDGENLYFSKEDNFGHTYYRFNGQSLDSRFPLEVHESVSIGDKHFVYATDFSQSPKVFEMDFDNQTLTEIEFPDSDSLTPNVSKLFDRNGELCVVANPDSSAQPGNNFYCLIDDELTELVDSFSPSWVSISEVISVGDELFFHALTDREVTDPVSSDTSDERELWVYADGEYFEMTQKGTTIGHQLFDSEGPVTSAFSQSGGWELFRVGYDQVTNTVSSTPVYSGPIISSSETIGGVSDFGIESVTQYRFNGQRLEGVSAVFIDGKPGRVISTAPDHIIITAPAGLDNGTHDLVIESPLGRLTYLDAITISESAAVETNSYGEVSAWTKRISDTQLKVYVKYPTVGEKVRISHQTGGSRSYESVYVKTTSSETMEGLRVVEGVGTYIVRTINLSDINRIQVTVGGSELVQVRYNN